MRARAWMLSYLGAVVVAQAAFGQGQFGGRPVLDRLSRRASIVTGIDLPTASLPGAQRDASLASGIALPNPLFRAPEIHASLVTAIDLPNPAYSPARTPAGSPDARRAQARSRIIRVSQPASNPPPCGCWGESGSRGSLPVSHAPRLRSRIRSLLVREPASGEAFPSSARSVRSRIRGLFDKVHLSR